MAKAADAKGVPDTPDEWLAGFPVMSIWQVFPEIEKIWLQNLEETGKTVKK